MMIERNMNKMQLVASSPSSWGRHPGATKPGSKRGVTFSQHILVDSAVIVGLVVELGDGNIGVLVTALPALRCFLHFARFALRGRRREHCTFYVRHCS